MPSVMQRIGTPNGRHNLDNEYRKHLENVDPSLMKYNDVVRKKSVEDIYQEKLQPAFEAFNAKQKRKDRRLDVKWKCSTALEYQRALDKAAKESKNKIDQNGRPPIREIVWQFGNPEQGYGSKGQTEESRNQIKKMLLEAQAKAEQKYPQLAWGDLVFHADEVSQDADDKEHGSLHLHSSFVPLCLQNKQGPGVQVAFERCLKEMGFSSFEAWKHDLDLIMEEVLHDHGLERTVMGNQEKHQDSKQFHRQQRIIRETRELEAKKTGVEGKVRDLEADLASAAAELQELKIQQELAEKQAAEQAEQIRIQQELAQRQLQEQLQKGENALAERQKELEQVEARHKMLEEHNEELFRANEYNEKIIAEKSDLLGLIKEHEDYLDVNDMVNINLDQAEDLLKALPEQAKIFKTSAAETMVAFIMNSLRTIMDTVEKFLRRMNVYEAEYDLQGEDKLSAPAMKRKDSLDKQISGAADTYADMLNSRMSRKIQGQMDEIYGKNSGKGER